MVKIIFIDIDGTLKDELARIPKSIQKVIALCKQKGIHLCLCTGRSIGTIQEDVMQLPIENVIAGGGNYIAINQDIIFQDSFDQAQIKHIVQYGITENCAIALEGNYEMFMNKKARDIFVTMNRKFVNDMTLEEKQYYQENEKIVYEDNIHMLNCNIHRIHKICVWCEEETFEKMSKIIQNYQLVQKNKWDSEYYYELVNVGCDKGSAVKKVVTHFGLTQEMSMCFGNGKNDIDMFKQCQIRVAMADSDEQLKHYASSICEVAHEDGILNELKRRNVI